MKSTLLKRSKIAEESGETYDKIRSNNCKKIES